MLGLAPIGGAPLGGIFGGSAIVDTCATGMYALTGKTASFGIVAKLPAAYGAYVLTGKAAYPKLDTAANFALPGYYNMSGYDAEFLVTKSWTDQDCTESPWSRADPDCICE